MLCALAQWHACTLMPAAAWSWRPPSSFHCILQGLSGLAKVLATVGLQPALRAVGLINQQYAVRQCVLSS